MRTAELDLDTTYRDRALAQEQALPVSIKQSLAAALPQLPSLLPPDITVEQFRAALVLELGGEPGLAECPMESLREAFVTVALRGLLPGRDCHIVPFRNKKTNRKEATVLNKYQGLIRMLDRTGKVAKAFAHPVYEGDHFEVDYLADIFHHRPALGSKRRAIKFYYGCITLLNGTRNVEVLTLDEVDDVKRRAPSSSSGPWQTDPIMMARKTALHRVAKYVQLTPQVQQALEEEDALPPAAPSTEQQAQTTRDLYGERPERAVLPPAPASEVPVPSDPGSDPRATWLNHCNTLRTTKGIRLDDYYGDVRRHWGENPSALTVEHLQEVAHWLETGKVPASLVVEEE